MNRDDRHWSTLLIPALLSVGCSVDARPPVVEQSQHLILRAPPSLQVCGGTFSRMESEVVLIRALFEGGPEPVDYVWMPASHYAPDEFPCFISDYGCTSEHEVYSRTLASTHELVHAARTLLPWLLEEGLATVSSEPYHPTTDILAPREQLLEAFDAARWSDFDVTVGLYERAAHFTSFLIASEGMDEYLEFERHVRALGGTYDTPFVLWESAFEDVYGQTFDAIWTAYETYPDCPPAQFHRPLALCASLEVGPEPEAILTPAFLSEPGPDATFQRVFECEGDDVFGPIIVGDEHSRASAHLVELDVPGTSTWVSLAGETSEGSRAILTNCGDCWDGSAALVSDTDPKALANLQSGLHVLVLHQTMDEAGAVGIELSL